MRPDVSTRILEMRTREMQAPAKRSASPLRLEEVRPARMHSILSKTNLALGLLCAAAGVSAASPEAALHVSIIYCEKKSLPNLLPPVVLDVFEVVSATEQKNRRSP